MNINDIATAKPNFRPLTVADVQVAETVPSPFRRGPFQSKSGGVLSVDLVIPGGGGGLATLPHIKAIDPAIKVIASSGYSDDPIILEPARYGFSASLIKPYQKDEMASVLESVLKQRRG